MRYRPYHRFPRRLVCVVLSLAVLSLVPLVYITDDGNLLPIVVVPLRTLARFALWGHWKCFDGTAAAPLNEAGLPANRFGVVLIHVPQDPEKGFDNYQAEIFQIATRNRLSYCQKHNYTFLNGTAWAEQHPAVLKQLHGRTHWLKSLFIQDILHSMPSTSRPQPVYPELDWILFLDTDIMIMNTAITIDQIIAGALPEEGIVVTTEADRVNAGAFLVANTPAGRAVIDIWATGAKTSGWSDQKYFHGMFDERTQRLHVNKTWPGNVKVNTTMIPRYRVVKPCALQSCSGLEYSRLRKRPYTEGFYARGDFAVHFFGFRDKLSLMRIAESGSIGFFS